MHITTIGYYFLLGSSLISWRSKKQTHVACSNTELEYRAFADTTSGLLWLRWLLKDLGVPFILLTMISSMNGLNTSRSIVIYLVHGALKLISVSSKDQFADIFTKSHPEGRLRTLVNNLKLVSHPPWVWGVLLTCIRVCGLRPALFTCITRLYCTICFLYKGTHLYSITRENTVRLFNISNN